MQRISKYLLPAYIALVVAVSVMPFGGTSASLNSVTVLSFRLDYLLHALVFIPLAPVWRTARPQHPWLLIIAGSIMLAVAAETSHYILPYRSYNVNDLLGNVIGALIGIAVAALMAYFLKIRATARQKQENPVNSS